MLQTIYLIHSANFTFAKVDLRRDLFFTGDNGSGKTSFIRAIHFLYSGDSRVMGIPGDKKGFKEYYFPYENSYIVYTFEAFFIFMYKRGGEIVKYFSKQPFSIDRIKTPSGDLRDFSEIRSYIRTPLHVRTTGIDDYTAILYGRNRKYLDFKIAEISNPKVFMRLYNTVFNIDKAIIDAKSVKQALFTSLDLERESAFFDPDEYVRTINEFDQYNRLFLAFTKESKTIEQIDLLRQSLLDLQPQMLSLARQINYRSDYEAQRLKKNRQSLEVFHEELVRLQSKQQRLETIFTQALERKDVQILNLRQDLKEIERLKATYTTERLQGWRSLSDEAYETQRMLSQKQEQAAKLRAGVSSAAQELEEQIAQLEREREEELPRRMERALHRWRLQEEEKLQRARQELEEKALAKESRIDERIDAEEKKIEELEKKREEIERRIDAKRSEMSEIDAATRRRRRERERQYDEARKTIEARHRESMAELARLEREKARQEEGFAHEQERRQALFEKECQAIRDLIATDQNLLHPAPESFRAFLDEEAEEWREVLYPLLDKSLLNLPQERLKPRRLNGPLLGITLDTSSLPTLPGSDELKERIERNLTRLRRLEEHFEIESERRKTAFKEKISQRQIEIETLRHRLRNDESRKEEIEKEYEKSIEEIDRQGSLEIGAVQEKIRELQMQKREIAETIASIRNEIVELKKRRRRIRSSLEKTYRSLQEAMEKSQALFLQKQEEQRQKLREAIDQKIADHQGRKKTVLKEEHLIALEEEIQRLQEKSAEIRDAQIHLQKYEEHKATIDAEPGRRKALERTLKAKKRLIRRKRACWEHYRSRESQIRRELESLKKEIKTIEEGLDEAIPELLSADREASRTFLKELKQAYRRLVSRYENDLIKLKKALDRINAIPGIRRLDNIHFDLALFDEELFLGEIPAILANIDNLLELQGCKLDTIKKSQQTKLENFVKNLYNKKLELFANAEEEFFKLVSKVNKELRSVDFGVVSDIAIDTEISNEKSIATMLETLKRKMADMSSLFVQDSLFFDRNDASRHLGELSELFERIKKELKGDRISLADTIDLSLSFQENGVRHSRVVQLKNESSTGGSILLKLALAISILRVYIHKSSGTFFLIVDEVSRLHSGNQRRLKDYANASGFRILFVTPEPIFADKNALLYYRFVKRDDGGFEAIALNRIAKEG